MGTCKPETCSCLENSQCSNACGCSPECYSQYEGLPKTTIQESEIAGAGLGLFAAEDIANRRIIGTLRGTIERITQTMDSDLFDISPGYAIRCEKEGVFFTSEKPYKEANAELSYREEKRGTEVTLRAKRPIKAGEEICAQYGDKNA
jgi:SET domain-containing protein